MGSRHASVLALLSLLAACDDGDPPALGGAREALLGDECEVSGQVVAVLEPGQAYSHEPVIHYDRVVLAEPGDTAPPAPLAVSLVAALGEPAGQWALEPDGAGWTLFYTGTTGAAGRSTLDVELLALGGDCIGEPRQQFSIAIGHACDAVVPWLIEPYFLPSGMPGSAYRVDLTTPIGTFAGATFDPPDLGLALEIDPTDASRAAIVGTPLHGANVQIAFDLDVGDASCDAGTKSIWVCDDFNTLPPLPELTVFPSVNVGQGLEHHLFQDIRGFPYSLSVVEGTLPPGLELISYFRPGTPDVMIDGTILYHHALRGTATTAGTWTFAISFSSFGHCPVVRRFQLTVAPVGVGITCPVVTGNCEGGDGISTLMYKLPSAPPGMTVTCDPPPGSTTAWTSATIRCTLHDADGTDLFDCFSHSTIEAGDIRPLSFTLDGPEPWQPLCGDFDPRNDPYGATAFSHCYGDQHVSWDWPGPQMYADGTGTATYTLAGTRLTRHLELVDAAPPTVTCSDVAPRECTGPGGTFVNPFTGGNFAYADDCVGFATMTTTGLLPSYPLGQTPITRTVTDLGGTTVSCTAMVNVVDTTPPLAFCDPPVTVECAGRFGTPRCTTPDQTGCASIGAIPYDTCSPVTITSDAPDEYPQGTTDVVFTARDAEWNARSCRTSVTVVDTTPPRITCPAGAVAECTSPAGAVLGYKVVADDLCSSPTTTTHCDVPSGVPYPVGDTVVTCDASDGTNTSAACSFVARVTDSTPPALTCPADVIAECTGSGGASVDPGTASATDACTAADALAVTRSRDAGFFPVGETVVTHRAVDGAGLATTCESRVTVRDTAPPVATVTRTRELWPPNHKYVEVGAADCGLTFAEACTGTKLDESEARFTITHVTSDEPDDSATGDDGATHDDIAFVSASRVRLRAERDGQSDGRVYQLGFRYSDPAGNQATGTCRVEARGVRDVTAVDSGARLTVDNPFD